MQTAIRNVDGTLISDGVWDAIKVSSRHVSQSLLSIKTTTRDAAKNKTKQFFKSYYSAEWREAITQLEELQPLVQHCAAHWKADHVLGATLAYITLTTSRTGPSSKRRAQEHEIPVSKKARSDLITTTAIRTMHERNIKTSSLTDGRAPLPYSPGGTLGTAMFSRKNYQSSSSTGTTTTQPSNSESLSSTTSLNSSQPQAVDPSCGNLISKCFRQYAFEVISKLTDMFQISSYSRNLPFKARL